MIFPNRPADRGDVLALAFGIFFASEPGSFELIIALVIAAVVCFYALVKYS